MDGNLIKSLLVSVLLLVSAFAGGFYGLPNDVPRWLYAFDAIGIIAGAITSVFAIIASSIAYTNRYSILDFLSNRRNRPEFYNTGHPFGENVDAVIIPVSDRGTEQPEWIINHLKPKYVAFLCSRESCGNAIKIMSTVKECTFINNENDLVNKTGEILTNPRNPQDVKNLTKCFIAGLLRRGVARDRIFVDTTGGLVPMSIGSFQGAEEEGVSTIYINGTVQPGNRIEKPEKREHGDPIFMSDRTSDAHIS